ncbi:MAG: hypothetical protein J0M04_23150 [Verrucomicrobia bacterium]|nr:hypothetical protein [Verrucomicrobiota bacterium]
MNRAFLTILIAASGALANSSGHAAEPDFATVERNFRELPPAARELTGPLFWLHGDETKERLEMYVGKVAEGGNGSLTAESRPHNDWLGPNWYRDVDICLQAAKKHGLKLWIFDEKWWPSQGVGGRVPPRYAAKRLVASAVKADGSGGFEQDGFSGECYIGAVAGRLADDDSIDGASLLDLAPFVHDGKLIWKAPPGRWQVMKFTHEQAPGLGQGGGRQLSVDGMSQDCVQWFLQTVYQPHYDRYREDFGKTIVGFFYDEPETRGDWGTGLNTVLAEHGVDWKTAYVGYKFRLSGDGGQAARFAYLDARAETWGRTMYGMTTKWCEARGVKSIGHFMEHGTLYRHQDFCAGDLMRVQKYSSMGGIDAVFSQFKMGERAANDAPCWQTPKLGSSVTHAYGKTEDVTMCEIFGARGQDLTYPEMKWWADAMHVAGVNFLIPHSFNPRAPYDTDCPPYFYNGGFEPRFPLYRVFADYTSRLSVMLTGGRHVAPVALVTPGQSAHVGKFIPPERISENLQDALYDCDWIPYEVLEKEMKTGGSELHLRAESYKILFLPAVEVMPYQTLARAREFFDSGGVVVTHGFLPTKSATVGKSAADIAALRDAIWGAAQPGLTACGRNDRGGRSYLLPETPTPAELRRVLAEDATRPPTLEVIEGDTGNWLHVLHRIKADRDVFFVTNQNHKGPPRKFRFRITATGVPECWDAMRNEIRSISSRREGGRVELELIMEPNESALLVFQPEDRRLPSRPGSASAVGAAVIPLTRIPNPPHDEPAPDPEAGPVRMLEGCPWIWSPEADSSRSAAAETRYFRKRITLPDGAVVRTAVFTLTADNSATVSINGGDAGHTDGSTEGWRNPVALDVAKLLRPGANTIAITASNAPSQNDVNPAGLIGSLRVEFERGEPLLLRMDRTWKVSRDAPPDWTGSGFDDSTWTDAKEVARFGGGPWGRFGGKPLTLSPVKADPFVGHCDLPAGIDPVHSRVYLECDVLTPEEAARITVNDAYAGGFLGRPLRLDITKHLKPGPNTIRIEPFAPKAARLVVVDR